MKSLNLKTRSSISSEFVQVYRNVLNNVVLMDRMTPHRVLSLRASQMPFCPVRFFINHATRGLNRDLDLAGSFYTSVGNTVHTVMQKYITHSGCILGDYHCLECKTWHRRSFRFECCGFPTQYHEIEIDWRGIKGHIDGIFRDKQGRLWILDFKTTSRKSAPRKKTNPGITYIEQLEVYAVLFELQYGMKIAGIMNAFILRDNPKEDPVMWVRELTEVMRKTVRVRLTRYKKMHQSALDASTLKEAMALKKFGKCKDPYCRVCPKTDDIVSHRIRNAVRIGIASKHLPIRELAEREILRRQQRKN
jgi:hypothetical protein